MIQLQIDFLTPYELTPTYEEIMWMFSNYGEYDIPVTIIEQKRKRKRK